MIFNDFETIFNVFPVSSNDKDESQINSLLLPAHLHTDLLVVKASLAKSDNTMVAIIQFTSNIIKIKS